MFIIFSNQRPVSTEKNKRQYNPRQGYMRTKNNIVPYTPSTHFRLLGITHQTIMVTISKTGFASKQMMTYITNQEKYRQYYRRLHKRLMQPVMPGFYRQQSGHQQ